MPARPFLYCFSVDLRLDDHAGIASAAVHGEVLPVLIIDEPLAMRLRASPRRASYFCGAVSALASELQELGSGLIVRRGERDACLSELAAQTNAAGAAWSASYDAAGIAADRRAQETLQARGHSAEIVHDAPAIAPDDIDGARGGSTGYRAFAPYLERWATQQAPSYEQPLLLRFSDVRSDVAALPQPREFGSTLAPAECGSVAARARLDRFLTQHAGRYAISGPMPSEDGTSHLGADLSFGTISARKIVRRVRDAINNPFAIAEQRLAYRLFLRELARRDFFLQLSWHHPETQDEALQEKMRGFRAPEEGAGVEAWCAGRTGYPLVDAGMRELEATGWMHPHVRAVVASFLCFDLGMDWRVGRDYWNGLLVEDAPALATGNWQWIAGVGADMAQFPRIYNPERQRRRCDPAGEYVRRWIPELRHVPAQAWYGKQRDSHQIALPLFDGTAYPAPMLDHAEAARRFLARYRDFVSP
jgi:deoxyribodipyrimidine photo-lyase